MLTRQQGHVQAIHLQLIRCDLSVFRKQNRCVCSQPLSEKSAKKRRESLERLLEEEDDLEFTVSFPSPSPGLSTVFEQEEPVVFILGWEGAGEADLARSDNHKYFNGRK